MSAAWEIDFFGRLQSLNDQALQQYFATAQARKAFEILLVSAIANQYLTLLAYDELLAVTQRTLETAQASYRLTLLQFQTGIGTELSVRQSETIVEQAKANYSAQLRGRAQAENALVLLLGQPLPEDLPPPAPLNAQTILADIPADLPSDLLTRRPDIMQAEATLRGANANIGAARAAFFPTISLTGNLGTASSSLSGLFKGGSLAWSFLPSITLPIFQGGQAAGEPRCSDTAKGYQRRPVRKGDPDGVSRSGRRPCGARHVRRRGGIARTLHRGPAAPTRAVGPAVPERRGHLPHRAYGANRFVQRPADAGVGAPGASHQLWSICTVRSAAGGSNAPAMRRVPPRMSGRSCHLARVGVCSTHSNAKTRPAETRPDSRNET